VIVLLFVFDGIGKSFTESCPASGEPEENWWKYAVIIGDRRVSTSDAWLKTLSDLRVQAVDHVGGWNVGGLPNPSKSWVQTCHDKGVKALSYLSIEVERESFAKYYESLPDARRWMYLNGSMISNPFDGGAAKNLFGEPCGHWHIYQGKPMPGSNLITMSLHNPNFVTWQLESAKIHLDAGADGLSWLNPEMEPFSVTGDFSHWANGAFRKYLARKFDSSSLLSLGIQNVETFEMSTYLLGKYSSKAEIRRGDPGGSQVTITTKTSPFDDPMLREWVKFQRVSLMDFFDQVTSKIREYGRERQRPVALLGNLMVREGSAMFESAFMSSLLIGKYFDVVHLPVQTKDIKVTEYVPEWSSGFRLEPAYKIATAVAGHRKPVWAYSGWKLDIPKHISHGALNLRKMTIAEAYAQGAIREIMFADWLADYDPVSPPPSLRRYLEFIWGNQRYLRGISSGAKVALVYSIPSFLWRLCPLFNMYGWSQRASIHGLARALEDGHVPYDMIIFGHPELYEDQSTLADLSRYDVIVLPNVDCMSDKQVEAIKEFLRKGGAIVACGEVATRNEDYVGRGGNVLLELTRLGGSRVAHLPDQPERAYWDNVVVKGTEDNANLERIMNALRPVSRADQLKTDGRRLVSISCFVQSNPFPRMVLHFINYNYDFQDDSVRVQEKLPVQVRLPQEFQVGKVECRSPDNSLGAGCVDLPFRRHHDGLIEFEVPRLFLWNVVTIRTEKEIQLDNSAVTAVREAELSVEAARKEQRTVGLNDAVTLLRASQDEHLRGNYEEAIDMATRAKEAANKATRETLEAISFSIGEHWPLILVFAAAMAVGSYVLVKKRRIAREPNQA